MKIPLGFTNVPPKKKTNMTMENPLFEDVFPIENWDFRPIFRGNLLNDNSPQNGDHPEISEMAEDFPWKFGEF